MGYFALVKEGVVVSVIVADQAFIDEISLETLQADLAVDVSAADQRPGPDYTYDSETEAFTAPE